MKPENLGGLSPAIDELLKRSAEQESDLVSGGGNFSTGRKPTNKDATPRDEKISSRGKWLKLKEPEWRVYSPKPERPEWPE